MKTSHSLPIAIALASLFITVPSLAARDAPVVYVTFWFDTEDFILPQADDAAKRLADMFSIRHRLNTAEIWIGTKASATEQRIATWVRNPGSI